MCKAFIAFAAILVQSISPLRHAFYEAFLHLHILLAIASMVGLWYHLRGMSQQTALLVTLILWGFDVSHPLRTEVLQLFSKNYSS